MLVLGESSQTKLIIRWLSKVTKFYESNFVLVTHLQHNIPKAESYQLVMSAVRFFFCVFV